MIGVKSLDTERKVLEILKIISESPGPLGGMSIARRLSERGIKLTERAVRYHLKITDEQGLTLLVGRDGRLVTEQGWEEISNALVFDKVGLALTRIELLASQTTFNWKTKTGLIPVNLSIFSKDRFNEALTAMAPVFKSGLSTGNLVIVVQEGERLGDKVIPKGKIGFGTVCSVLINGILLRLGIPIDSRFGGILQVRNYKPLRFVELIHYDGSSIDPSEIFIRGKMTTVAQASKNGNGRILANFRQVPAVCRPVVEDTISGLKGVGLGGLFAMGHPSEPVNAITVDLNKIGMILLGGMNPIAAADEAGIPADNQAMSTVIDFQSFTIFESLLSEKF